MTEELGQALVDELRQYGLARYVVTFTHGPVGAALGRSQLYRAVEHQDGRDAQGNILAGVFFEEVEEPQIEALVNTKALALLEARFEGKQAGGILKVDESGRVWAHELQESALDVGDGTKVRLEL